MNILEWAIEEGFADAKLVSPEGAREYDSCAFLADTKSVLVLFYGYRATIPQEGHIGISNYYIASNAAYFAAKSLKVRLEVEGISVAHAPSAPAKFFALKSGGFIGKNSLYYHPQLGSMCAIQILLTNISPDTYTPTEKNPCKNCTLCEMACPTGAIKEKFHRENCLREYMESISMNPLAKPYIYQLLGCEKCQIACPHNNGDAGSVMEFQSVEDSLSEIRALVGKNMAKPSRILEQELALKARFE